MTRSARATTVRKVVREDNSGKTSSERVKMRLEIGIEEIDYDAVSETLRLRGKNRTECEHVRLGSYHTLEVELQREFSIYKDEWDSMAVERLRSALDPAAGADLAAVMITEGLANVCLVGGAVTTVRAKVESSLPRKKGAAGAFGYDRALEKFHQKVLAAVVKNVDWGTIKCLVVAGPGFAREQFVEYLHAEAVRQNLRPLIENKGKIVSAHASSGFVHSLKEVLSDEAIASRIKDTQAARETQALGEFMEMLGNDPDRAFYGPIHVAAAHAQEAIKTLLVSDALFRAKDIAERKRYVALVEGVREAGGEVLIFSSAHVSGKQLTQLSGVAAVLRFPLPDIDELDMEGDIVETFQEALREQQEQSARGRR